MGRETQQELCALTPTINSELQQQVYALLAGKSTDKQLSAQQLATLGQKAEQLATSLQEQARALVQNSKKTLLRLANTLEEKITLEQKSIEKLLQETD